MRIRRTRLKGDFVQIPNSTVRDERLSYMARGILVELLSRPDGWEATADDMWRASTAIHGKSGPGRRAFRSSFAELKAYGYLTASSEPLDGGRYGTVLTLTDVPHGGTSERPAETSNDAAQTDVPAGGTSVPPGKTGIAAGRPDVPPTGTSASPAETNETAGRTDVPHAGTPAPPAETGLFAAHSDVPHGGTSKDEYVKTNTGLNTSSSARSAPREISAEDKVEFGNFWTLFPKSQDYDKTRDAWIAAVRTGDATPQEITASAVRYARDQSGTDWQFIKTSANWLRDRRYLDKHAPEPTGKPHLHAVDGQRPGGIRGPLPTADDINKLTLEDVL